MSQLKGVFSWRLLMIVAGLFLLSLLAPFGWNRNSRNVSRHLGKSSGGQVGSGFRVQGSESTPHSALRAPHSPQLAPLGPLVADQIDLDPSILQTPALPDRPTIEPDFSIGPVPAGDSYTADQEPARPRIDLPSPPATISPEPALGPDPPVTMAWPYPAGLIEQLNILAAEVPSAAGWAQSVNVELESLAEIDSLANPAAAAKLDELNRLADAGKQLALTLPNEADRSKVLRAGYAIVRRIVVWEQVHQLASRGDAALAPIIDRRAGEAALVKVERRLAATGVAAAWREYLRINEARERFDSADYSPADQRELARDILHRLHSTQLSRDQEQFLAAPPFAAWSQQLAIRASTAPDLVAVLAAIERHEHNDDQSQTAQAVAAACDELRWSPDEGIQELAETLNAYYRNANVRVALSSHLVNRMLPKAQQLYEPVVDTIQEAEVRGESLTTTRVRLVLVPDRHRWNIGLEANGEVASNTSSSKGPAKFYQNSTSLFRARKRVTVDRRGIRLQDAEAAAGVNNNLDDFETDFDGIPLLGNLVRAIARNQYETSQPAAREEVAGKIVWRASSQLDREVAEKLEKAKRDLQAKLIDPLQRLDLEPTAVDMETTAERLIARFRMAGRDQISAHTPRPQAPGDSILSVQIHETAMNNVLDHLKLHGKRIELRELYKDMTERFSQEKVQIPEDLPENVYVTFADEDPVRVDCHDGRVRLQIRLKDLIQEGTNNHWTNFTVRGYYQPVADQLDANLERVPEVPIELIGDRLGIGDRVALSGIFGKVLSRNRKLNLINKQIARAPELHDQQVTQFVIHDGWIGVALGPKTPGRTAALHPRSELKVRTE
ncbi:MAG: hypothetical protein L0211_16140 [Planctomycetaceae bacterium]|nr:hypothetical protein [Planctomycetaceae bacterium]